MRKRSTSIAKHIFGVGSGGRLAKDPVRKGPAGRYVVMTTPVAAAFVLTRASSRGGVRSFEAAFEAGARTVDATVVETVLSRRIDDLEPQLIRHGYDARALCEQFDAKPAEIRQLFRGGLSRSVRPS